MTNTLYALQILAGVRGFLFVCCRFFLLSNNYRSYKPTISEMTHFLIHLVSTPTCLSPPAPCRTAPWQSAAARRSWSPHRSVRISADRSLCCRRAGSWRWGPTERQKRAGWGRPSPLPLCWPVRWTETPGSPWDGREMRTPLNNDRSLNRRLFKLRFITG